MELNFAQKEEGLKGHIPEIKQILEILKYMLKERECTNPTTLFLLAYANLCQASVVPPDKVCLSLGGSCDA